MKNTVQNLVRKVLGFFIGADLDTSPNLPRKDGVYYDSTNARYDKYSGNDNTFSKIGGETTQYAKNSGITDDYRSVGFFEVNKNKIELYAPYDITKPSIIRINGLIMVKSVNLGFSVMFPFQYALNDTDNNGYGEFYITDYNLPPLYFSLEDIITNYNNGSPTSKYFGSFVRAAYQSQTILEQTDRPNFVEYITSTQGLQYGTYAYAISLVDAAGNITQRSPFTPLIPIIRGKVNLHAYTSAEGGNPLKIDYSGVSPVGGVINYSLNEIHLTFRFTNLNLNFKNIIIIRQQYTTQPNIGNLDVILPEIKQYTLPTDYSTTKITVVDFMDSQLINWIDVPTNQQIREDNLILKAKGIAYKNNVVELGNIAIASKDLNIDNEDQIENIDAFPIVENIGSDGHYDPKQWSEKRSYARGEQYYLAIKGVQINNGNTNAAQILIDGQSTNQPYQFPDRRDPLMDTGTPTSAQIKSFQWSASSSQVQNGYYGKWKGVQLAATKSSINNTKDARATYEIFGFGDTGGDHQNDGYAKTGTRINDLFNLYTDPSTAIAPIQPISFEDAVLGHDDSDYQYMFKVGEVPDSQAATAGDNRSSVMNPPKGFLPNYYALGVGLDMSNVKPFNNCNGFTVVRSKPANRIIAQGIGFYRLDTYTNPIPGQSSILDGGKLLNTLRCYCPDIDPKLFNTISDLTKYKVELVSPLGYFSEAMSVFHTPFDNTTSDPYSLVTGVDMMVYARILYENYIFNSIQSGNYKDGTTPILGDPKTIIGNGNNSGTGDGFVSFGKYRNQSAPTYSNFGTTGNPIFGITNVIPVSRASQPTGSGGNTEQSRNSTFDLELDGNVYNSTSMNYDPAVFQEPIWIINIIDVDSQIQQQTTEQWLETGTFIKYNSTIGILTDPNILSFELVDERPDDCFANPNDIHQTNPDAKFIYVNGNPWLHLSAGQIATNITAITTGLHNNGYYDLSVNPSGAVRIYGIYAKLIQNNKTYIQFYSVTSFASLFGSYPQPQSKCLVPTLSSEIVVRFDASIPVRVFGGDMTIGECYPALYDGISGTPNALSETKYWMNFLTNIRGLFPYGKNYLTYIELSKGQRILNDITASSPSGATLYGDDGSFAYPAMPFVARQISIAFACESRLATTFLYPENDTVTTMVYGQNLHLHKYGYNRSFFPIRQYMQRPNNYHNPNGVVEYPSNKLNFPNYFSLFQNNVIGKNLNSGANGQALQSEEIWNWILGGITWGTVNTTSWYYPNTGLLMNYIQNTYSEGYSEGYDATGFSPEVPQEYSLPYSVMNNYAQAVSFLAGTVIETLKNGTLMIWSLVRSVFNQMDRQIKTFPSENSFYLEDAQGEIKMLWNNTEKNNDNLIAMTEHGACLMPINKIELTDASLTPNQPLLSNQFISQQVWISRKFGMPDQTWRSAIEISGSLFFTNTNGVFVFNGSHLDEGDRVDNGYWSKLYPVIQSIATDCSTTLSVVYDALHEEYWLNIQNPVTLITTGDSITMLANSYYIISDTLYVHNFYVDSLTAGDSFVYSSIAGALLQFSANGSSNSPTVTTNLGETYRVHFNGTLITISVDIMPSTVYVYNTIRKTWQGIFTYSYEQYLCDSLNNMYGIKNLVMNLLNKGTQINGGNISMQVIADVVGEVNGDTYEIVNILISSNLVPSLVEFADNILTIPQCYLGNTNFRNYTNTWFSNVPRKSGNGLRLQSNKFFIRITHNDVTQFVLTSIDAGLKKLK